MKLLNNMLLLSAVTCSLTTQCMLITKQQASKIKPLLQKHMFSLSVNQSSKEKPYTPDPNSPLSDEKDLLNTKLYEARYWRGIASNDPRKYIVPFRYPEHEYGYVEKNGKFYNNALIDYDVQKFKEMTILTNARYNEYSGIAGVILAVESRHTDATVARQLLRKLLDAGMIPTEKDKKLIDYLGESDLLKHE